MRTVAVVLLFVAAPAGAAPAGETIRVAIVEQTGAIELRGPEIQITELDGCDPCLPFRSRAEIVRAEVAGSSIEIEGHRATGFRLESARSVRVKDREYAGVLELVRHGSGMAVVNELPLEDYVAGVVRAEVGERWPPEALRAQAIVARTYAAYQRMASATKPFHIVASSAHQEFVGYVPPSSPVSAAVRDTVGQVLRWEGQLFPAFYHADSGGYTDDPPAVFAARNLPALKPVRCEFSAGSPHSRWNFDLRLADLSELLRRNGMDFGSVSGLEVTERTSSLRAVAVTVHGSRGSGRLRGGDFRRIVGGNALKSTLFAAAIDGQVVHFSGRGYGHGVGMCQWGAKTMAEQGYRAHQILEYFYRGATLGSLDAR